jgi:putative ABC transport system substrate-binding protein
MDIELNAIGLKESDEIKQAVAAFAQGSNDGLIVTASGFGANHFPPDLTLQALRAEVVALVARHRLPTIYSDPAFPKIGGLAFYGPDRLDLYRSAAGYVDRILRGEKPGDLPFQQPTKYQLILNLKTAKALGIELPPTVLALADEVIE